MLGNKTLLLALTTALLFSQGPAAVESRPYQRFAIGPGDWYRPTRVGKGERKRTRGSRWAQPARRTVLKPERLTAATTKPQLTQLAV